MPTNKQRREAAQRHLQRQLDRRTELAKKRRRNMSIVAAVVAALVVAGIVLLATDVFGGGTKGSDAAAAASSSSPAASAEDTAAPVAAAAPSTNADGSVACDYAPADPSGGEIIDVGTPPHPDKVPAKGTVDLKMVTNQGDIGLTLDRSLAPCAAESFAFLASKGFFDDTPCHRLVTAETFGVLQCGDPTGTGSGGPSYRLAQEVTPDTTYPRGTIAMANSGTPGSTGSQFFLVFNDAQLAPDYSVVGTIDDAGLKVLDEIAKAGDDGSFEPSPGGGAPNDPVQIKSMKKAG